MLPKIIVSSCEDREVLTASMGLVSGILEFDGVSATVDDLRKWIVSATQSVVRNGNYKIVVWNADNLSHECQTVLLKPLEELNEKIDLRLVVRNENKLLSTIISRCVVNHLEDKTVTTESYWGEVRKCWASGPAACISLSDSLSKEDAKIMVREIVMKLKDSLDSEISKNRLAVIDAALKCLADLEGTNINHKLSIDNFLLGSWRLVKA